MFELPRTGGQQQRHYEASGQRSRRDSDSIEKGWKKNDSLVRHTMATDRTLADIIYQLKRLQQRSGSGGDEALESFYPFKIYSSPSPAPTWGGWSDNGGSYGTVDTWTFFRVRAGRIGTTDVTGTDGDGTAAHPAYDAEVSPNLDPDLCGIPGFSGADAPTADNFGAIDFSVTAGEQWYVWIDNSNAVVPEINAASIAPTEHWPGSDYFLIGTIDCTNDTDKVSVIRQFRRQDVPLAYGCVDGTTQDMPL